MIQDYLKHKAEREALGIPPRPLKADQVSALVELLQNPGDHDPAFLRDLMENRVPAGVDEAAEVKAAFLADLAFGRRVSPLITPADAVAMLASMGGGYNIAPLMDLLTHPDLAENAARGLSGIILVSAGAVAELAVMSAGNPRAASVLQSWADADWFTRKPEVPANITLAVFKVDGEINTDDFSPASEAWSRPDIPLHALSMLSHRMDHPLAALAGLKQTGHGVVFIGDVVGTGSSRKSAVNSLLWHIGEDIPHIPNKRRGGVVLGGKIAPIFFNSLEDAGALPVECDISRIQHGDIIRIHPYEGRITRVADNKVIAEFRLKSEVLLDSARAGGRIPLIIGRTLTDRAQKALENRGGKHADPVSRKPIFRRPATPAAGKSGFTLAQKIVGRACGLPGVRPGAYCEPEITTVGSQDTTGPMTADELKELACLKFSADLVMQSFCHTAAYPRRVDIDMQRRLHDFIKAKGGVALLPGDGIIHAWLNRMLLPDTVGTGGDSHTRFPVGISFPAGSGLIAFAAAFGFMPLDMPESVLIRFTGKMPRGITWRDVVNAVPRQAISKGLLTVAKSGKKNIFSGRIMEFEGLADIAAADAYELTNASAERSAAGAVMALSIETVTRFLEENISILQSLLADGYGDADTLKRRIAAMKDWLKNPELLARDKDAEYAAELDVDLSAITEPVVACPNDPDDVRLLSDVAGTPVDDVFIGSCMTGISHLREAARVIAGKKHLPVRFWITPATRIDAANLRNEGLYSVFGAAGARIETPGCSLCMGNQARVPDGATVFSTSTRNFPNRLGNKTSVFLGSARLAAVCAILGRIPDRNEYTQAIIGRDRADL
jgi:aconitate hydratase 2 / 2-methylisocitrate dehydratase